MQFTRGANMPLRDRARAVRARFAAWRYRFYLLVLSPANALLALLLQRHVYPNSVLHISYMVHIPYETTRLLRQHGMKADYLAIGASPFWHRCDFQQLDEPRPLRRALSEFRMLWGVLARYEIIHLHFMITLSEDGWELAFLKRMGRKVVVHYRGCEIRDRERNMALHPEINLCQQCDYNATICKSLVNLRRRAVSRRMGDAFLVTTPDMLDFAPDAEHMPFFMPDVEPEPRRARQGTFRIVHVTAHPGLEGTAAIRRAIERLRVKGHDVEFVLLKDVLHREVLEAYRTADLAIGKMKMGYYANAQVESLALGVPTITHVRPEFVTEEILRSGLILTTLDRVEETIEKYLTDPQALEAKRAAARASAERLHGRSMVAARLVAVYDRIREAA